MCHGECGEARQLVMHGKSVHGVDHQTSYHVLAARACALAKCMLALLLSCMGPAAWHAVSCSGHAFTSMLALLCNAQVHDFMCLQQLVKQDYRGLSRSVQCTVLCCDMYAWHCLSWDSTAVTAVHAT